MRYQIAHITTYTYTQPVELAPHIVRLRPRSDRSQTLHSFSLEVVPEPAGISDILDIEGNSIVQMWFKELTSQLKIEVRSQVETHCENPFNYLLEPWATQLQIDYPASTLTQLQPYFHPLGIATSVDMAVSNLAQEVWHSTNGNTVAYLGELNQRLYQDCKQTIRETGDPLPGGITWNQKLGSCRDIAIVFIEACRAVGLAARFVSGYNEGDPDQNERHLHAWVEVYLPGAGWRGYDPTQGLAVADRHIAIVASALPRNAAPISGTIRGGGMQAAINYDLSIVSC